MTLAALVLSAPHFLARPHVLVLPVMLAWTYGLMSASERGEAPSFWLLPLIALWANLHGGFIFGRVPRHTEIMTVFIWSHSRIGSCCGGTGG